MPLTERRGDATRPDTCGPAVLVHVCNDVGGWGRGFVTALSARWPQPEAVYRTWWRHGRYDDVPFELGQVVFVPVVDGPDPLWVANLIGQHDIRPRGGVPPVRYDAIRAGLARVRAHCQTTGASVHAPRFGAGLAGGRWHPPAGDADGDAIGPIVDQELVAHGIDVTIYDLPAGR